MWPTWTLAQESSRSRASTPRSATWVDASVDAVGFEARGHGADAGEAPATVLNDVMTATRVGSGLGIPGLYVTGDPGAPDEDAKRGRIGIDFGLGWAKSHHFTTGQCPVKRYNR